jgi:hypothetical protein
MNYPSNFFHFLSLDFQLIRMINNNNNGLVIPNVLVKEMAGGMVFLD